MKAVFIGLLALAASFSATAQDAAADVVDPTALCLESIATDPRLARIADKVALNTGSKATSVPGLHRIATVHERAAVGTWLTLRRQCFDAGVEYRSIVLAPEVQAFTKSAFMFQQRLLGALSVGDVTYVEYSRRRVELAEGLASEL